MIRTAVLVATMAALALGLTACGGSRTRTETNVTSVSTGQQLTDLQAAYEQGAITEAEYEKKKKEILKAK